MHLVRLNLCNFRGFFGKQSITFAQPGDIGVTVIHGENGAGKTNLLNAIFWCLTGTFTPRLSNPDLLINKTALDNFKDDECYVDVYFQHEGVNYQATRTVLSRTENKLSVFRLDEELARPIDEAQKFIERIIPKALSRWFFFDAEAIGELELSGSDDFRKSLRRILGFELVDTLLADLQSCSNKKQKSLTNLVNNKTLDEIQNKIDNLESILPTQKAKAMELQGQISALEKQIGSIDKKLRELPKSKPLQDRRNRLDLLRKQKVTTKRELQEQAARYSGESGPSILVASKALSFGEHLHVKENTGRLPAPFSDQLVEDILKEGICVCGRPVISHTPEETKIKALLEHASTNEFNTRIRNIQYLLKDIGIVAEKHKEITTSQEHQIQSIDSEIATIDAELKEIRSELQNIDEESINVMENERYRLNLRFRELLNSEGVVCASISDNEKRIKELRLRHQNESKKLGLGSNVKTEIDKIRRLSEYVSKTLRDQEIRALQILMIHLNEVLGRYLTKHYFAKINSKSYGVDMVDDSGRHVGKSTGEGQVLKFAFITTVVALAGRKSQEKINFLAEPTVAPLVLDAPFSALDPEYQGSVAQNLAKQSAQLVLLLSSAAWGDSVANALNPSVGKRYVIISRQTGPRGDKPIKTQCINGEVISLNEYDCKRDESVIRELT